MGNLFRNSVVLFDLDKLNSEIAALDEEQNREGFWNDQKSALEVVNRLNDAKSKVQGYTTIKNDYDELSLLLDDPDSKTPDMRELIEGMEKELSKKIKELRVDLLFRGEYDHFNCTLDIHPGAGGTEANDWADMLFRMYNRYAESHHFKWQVLSYEQGEEAGLKSATVKISGKNVYGLLKGEKGVHRLVRISPFDSNARRHTSFASVNVIPEFGKISDVEIDPKDLKVDTFRSGGAGGQNVNKVSSAVRITHLPTGLVAQCQDERSQHRNKEKAMSVLKARLLDQRRAAEEAKAGQNRRDLAGNGDRSQKIRTYNYPQNRITDHRINYTAYNLSGVMEGDLGDMLNALRQHDLAQRLELELN
ncbi:MAG: peptide chain release factor 2 [Bacilli bacterium]|nr:peptide chain release factor 2 [Bacilli bacterium]